MDLNQDQGVDLTLTPDLKLIVPSGTPGKPALRFNLEAVLIAEGRLREVMAVTKPKSAELFHLFNDAGSKSARIVATLLTEEDTAERLLKALKAEIYLDRIPGLVKERAIKETEAIREALLNAQKDYQNLLELRDMIVAARRHMEIKVKDFDRAYFTIKDILSGQHDLNIPTDSPFGKNNYGK